MTDNIDKFVERAWAEYRFGPDNLHPTRTIPKYFAEGFRAGYKSAEQASALNELAQMGQEYDASAAIK